MHHHKEVAASSDAGQSCHGLPHRASEFPGLPLWSHVAEALARGYGDTREARRALHADETQLLVSRYLGQVVAPEVRVTPEEMADWYERHKESYHRPPRLRLRQITAATEAEAERLAALVRQGADVGWLARQHSTDGFKDAGGDRGWVTPKGTGEAFELSLFEAKPGDVLGPTPAPEGFTVVRVEAREGKENGYGARFLNVSPAARAAIAGFVGRRTGSPSPAHRCSAMPGQSDVPALRQERPDGTAGDFRAGLRPVRPALPQRRRLAERTGILPEGWVEYTKTPAPAVKIGYYGAQFWLNKGPADDPAKRRFPGLPEDLFWAEGYQGQIVAVLPSQKCVVVRLGMTYDDNWAMDDFLKDLVASVR